MKKRRIDNPSSWTKLTEAQVRNLTGFGTKAPYEISFSDLEGTLPWVLEMNGAIATVASGIRPDSTILGPGRVPLGGYEVVKYEAEDRRMKEEPCWNSYHHIVFQVGDSFFDVESEIGSAIPHWLTDVELVDYEDRLRGDA